jgi:hypothetical protein
MKLGRPEPDAANVTREPVRVLGHDLDRFLTIGLEDAHRARRAYAMSVEEDHDLPHRLLLGPALHNALGTFGANAADLLQALRLSLDNLEGVLAKQRHDAFGHGGTDPPHVAGGEVLLDALNPGRRRGLERLGLELEPVLTVGEPDAGRGDPLACPDAWGMADHRHEVALASGLHLQDAEARLGIVEGDAFHRARECLDRRATLELLWPRPGVHLMVPVRAIQIDLGRGSACYTDMYSAAHLHLINQEVCPVPSQVREAITLFEVTVVSESLYQ